MPDGVDVSSYNRAPLPTALDTVQKLGGLQQQKQQIESGALTIDKQKLDLVNQGYGYLLRELNSLPPEATADDLNKVAKNAVTMGIIKPDMYASFIRTMPTDPKQIAAFKQATAAKLLDTQNAINFHYGTPGTFDNGQTVTPVVQSPAFGLRATNPPIQKQIPVTTQTYGEGNVPTLQGPTPAQAAPGTVTGPLPAMRPGIAMPPPVGTANAMYEAQPQPATTAAPVPRPKPALPVQAPMELTPNQVIQGNYPPPSGPKVGMSPLFEAGKAQLVEDQNNATAKLTAIKPALQALPLLKDLTTGIGTDTYNKALAGLSNLGLLPKGLTDKTAAYQEVNKKLADYVRSSPLAARSDAAQALSQSASPDPKGQINQALVKLTKDAIILDRVQAARSGAFEGQDYAKYGEHRATFPAKIDERAFGLDLMEPKERQALLDEMHKKQNTFEGKKFWNSLAIVKRQGLIDTAQ